MLQIVRMKVLHINTTQTGGAAWCAIRINNSLVHKGVDTCMLFAEGKNMPEGVEGAIAMRDVYFWNRNWILRKIRNQLVKIPWFMDAGKLQCQINSQNHKQLYLHIPLTYYRNIAHHPLVEWADIIHLHWVSEFIDYPTFFDKIQKPIVWTLHDKYPAMGLQHYSSDFYPVQDDLKTLDKFCRKIKRNGVLKAKNLNIVAISEMMIDICEKSDVLQGFPVTLIHNGVDVDTYVPYDKYFARKELGLISDATIFLFSAYDIQDSNKGLDRVIGALEMINIQGKLLVCIGGFSNKPIPECSFPVILTGMVANQSKMAKYYSAADYFMQCSYEETFAQTPLEAMACGCPVISTPTGGAPELIKDFNGVICNGYDVHAIAFGIREVLDMKYNPDLIRQHIVENYQYDKIANQYIDLYSSILNR